MYPEDVPGEKEWKYVNCQVEKSSLGYIILISAIDMNGKEAKIQFDCVSGIEYNRNDFTQYFMKYYVVEKINIFKRNMNKK